MSELGIQIGLRTVSEQLKIERHKLEISTGDIQSAQAKLAAAQQAQSAALNAIASLEESAHVLEQHGLAYPTPATLAIQLDRAGA